MFGKINSAYRWLRKIFLRFSDSLAATSDSVAPSICWSWELSIFTDIAGLVAVIAGWGRGHWGVRSQDEATANRYGWVSFNSKLVLYYFYISSKSSSKLVLN